MMILKFFFKTFQDVSVFEDIGILPVLFHNYICNNHSNRVLLKLKEHEDSRSLSFYIMIDKKVFKMDILQLYIIVMSIDKKVLDNSVYPDTQDMLDLECVIRKSFDITIDKKHKKFKINMSSNKSLSKFYGNKKALDH